jgi:hypothetical protein
MEQDCQPAIQASTPPLVLSSDEELVVKAILDALRRIKHGSVQLVVQDSRVIQIDTVEKRRLADKR